MRYSSKYSVESLKMAFEQTFYGLMEEKYRPWTYESPFFLDRSRVAFFKKSQDIMLKLMRYMAENYDALATYLPHDMAEKSFLKQLQDVAFQEGTFRTDFVINGQNEVRLIEVTCRFPLNGYFRSTATNAMNEVSYLEDTYGLKPTSYARPLLEKFVNWMDGASRLIIIQGEDRRDNESKYMQTFFHEANIDLQICSYGEWLENGADWCKGAAIMPELTLDEWLKLPISLVKRMLERPLLNDPRIVLMVHDKGFFGLVNIEEITSQALSSEETAFIQQAFAETYLLNEQQPELLKKATSNPENWILKPRKLGRSVNIIAGSLVTAEEWETELNSAMGGGDMVLQKWHLSKKIRGKVQGIDYEDYFAGTLLYWGNEFFGPGFLRASSYPISNVKDNRMVTTLVDLQADPKANPKANPKRYPEVQWL